jgi:hypothetical protein
MSDFVRDIERIHKLVADTEGGAFSMQIIYNECVPRWEPRPRTWWKRLLWKPWVATVVRPGVWQLGRHTVLMHPSWRDGMSG